MKMVTLEDEFIKALYELTEESGNDSIGCSDVSKRIGRDEDATFKIAFHLKMWDLLSIVSGNQFILTPKGKLMAKGMIHHP
jgi:Mn-dependent DtxR family transcriptional regulator